MAIIIECRYVTAIWRLYSVIFLFTKICLKETMVVCVVIRGVCSNDEVHFKLGKRRWPPAIYQHKRYTLGKNAWNASSLLVNIQMFAIDFSSLYNQMYCVYKRRGGIGAGT